MPEPVRYERSGAVATVTLDRPDALNALDLATKDALLAAVDEAGRDEQVRAVVLTATGRAFCVGQDVKEHVRLVTEDPERVATTVERHYNPIALRLATMPKPVVAAVNGVAAGAGMSFTLACDFRLLADSAAYNTAFTGIALSCDSGASYWLPRLVGTTRAVELLMLPRTVGAAEALALGLATEVVPAAELPGRAAALAEQLAAGPTLAYACVKESLREAHTRALPDALAYEARMMARTGSSADHRDAVEAFVAKRPPTFDGR